MSDHYVKRSRGVETIPARAVRVGDVIETRHGSAVIVSPDMRRKLAAVPGAPVGRFNVPEDRTE